MGGKKADTDIIGITSKKSENFPDWYQQVVLKAEMIEYYNEISGFFILRPASMYIWNVIRKWFQERIEAMEVEEASFPMFLSSKSLEKEKDHVEGFAPELAWVTKAYVSYEGSAYSLLIFIVGTRISRFLSQSVLHPKLSCTLTTRNGFEVIEIFHLNSTSGIVLSDGRRNKQLHSSELVNSYGRKDIPRT